MASIRELGPDAGERRRRNPAIPRLPDFCNLGTWLRALLAANALALAAALARNRELVALPGEFTGLAVLVEPIALATLVVLCGGHRWLVRLPRAAGLAAAVAVAMAAGAGCAALLAPFLAEPEAAPSRAWFWSGLAAWLLVAWLDLTTRARSPAVAEARLMALTARIRPHFLFNSLNAVLGVIRTDPRRAEAALEELADLFRALMKDNRALVPLSEEIALARQYLELERLRLGERLQVRWDVESCPPDALVPPLLLQPLLENAVYHGVEPLDGPGEICITLARRGDRLIIEIANPLGGAGHAGGNQMAVANIRERLLLFFDLEATLDTEATRDRYRLRIELPYRRGGAG